MQPPPAVSGYTAALFSRHRDTMESSVASGYHPAHAMYSSLHDPFGLGAESAASASYYGTMGMGGAGYPGYMSPYYRYIRHFHNRFPPPFQSKAQKAFAL